MNQEDPEPESLKAQLQTLIEDPGIDTTNYRWVSEDDRWAELVFCILNRTGKQQPDIAREATTHLQSLGVLDVGILANIESGTSVEASVISYVLEHHGYSKPEVERCVEVLSDAAETMETRYQGKVQLFLRRHGERIRDDLIEEIGDTAMDDADLNYAVTHWLQNCLNMPLPLEHDAVVEFCEENDVEYADLMAAADELDLNTALVDDLLQMAHWKSEMAEETSLSERGESRS